MSYAISSRAHLANSFLWTLVLGFVLALGASSASAQDAAEAEPASPDAETADASEEESAAATVEESERLGSEGESGQASEASSDEADETEGERADGTRGAPTSDPTGAPGRADAYGAVDLQEHVVPVDDALSALEIVGVSMVGTGVTLAATGGLVWTIGDEEIAGQSVLGVGSGSALVGMSLIFAATFADDSTGDDVEPDADESEALEPIGLTPSIGENGAALSFTARF